MEHIKKNWLIYVLLILVIILLIGWKKFGWFTISVNVNDIGTNPDPSVCGAGRSSSRDVVCTNPLYQVIGNVKERCWSYESLGFEPGPITTIKPPSPYNKKWYYNRQEGDKYCFVDDNSYPLKQN